MPIGTAIFMVGKMVICAIIASAGALGILSAWFDRRLLTWEALLLAAGLIVLMFHSVPLAMESGSGILILLVAVAGMALVLRGLSGRVEQRLGKGMDEEDVGRYRAVVEQHPENPHAHSLLADTYRRVGELELAAREYEEALRIDPSLKQERYWLQWLGVQSELRKGKNASCARCQAVRPARTPTCPTCGHSESALEG
jgi:tetratricopeptide (TPR) repeat protein